MKKIFIILAHTAKDSFNKKLADTYEITAKKNNHQVRRINLGEINFSPVLFDGYKSEQPLEPDLVKAQENLVWADHLVIIFPTWWTTYPAILKGFIDRVFLPGFAFNYEKGRLYPGKDLKNKSARIITTVDAPRFYYLFFGHPGLKALKYGTLKFCGFKKVSTNIIGSIRSNIKTKKEKWLKIVEKYAQNGL